MSASPEIPSLSLSFIESLYADYERDPSSVSSEWRRYFDRLAHMDGNGEAASATAGANGQSRPSLAPVVRREVEVAVRQDRVDQLVRSYRVRGHMAAQIDPLNMPRPPRPELDPAYYGFTEDDLDQPVSSRTIYGPDIRTLRQIIQRLRNTYCRSIGVQFMHIDDLPIRTWLQERMEASENRTKLTRDEQIRIYSKLSDAAIFEEFVQKKYVGAKSFSLEGSESLIPMLDMAIEMAGEDGVKEVVLGMAHRGRLNVLANIIGKSPQQIFREFEDVDIRRNSGGDVKYHLGYSGDHVTASGNKVHLSLCFNPSHLEFVNPVAIGRTRAKQDRVEDKGHHLGMCVLIHGDAAFIGEGVVQETLNMSELAAYTVGGTIHIIVNNQIGFTTPPEEARSTFYAAGVAKMLQIPIFHVNGEDPEAVASVMRLAMDFRQEFQRDIVIDMYGYRRHGHNEGDEPDFTQPLLYAAIKKRKNVREAYLEQLLKLGEITPPEADRIVEQRKQQLETDLATARREDYVPRSQAFMGIWNGYRGGPESGIPEIPTGVPVERLAKLLDAQTRLPEDFHSHPKIQRLLAARQEMAQGVKPLDWAAGEALAIATLATEGVPVRLTGQDSERGTFSHRHAVLHDVQDGHEYTPLRHLAPNQARVDICNSPLSEAGVLGFEYGYSLDYPDGLVMWEAQFGDFVNAAQVIIDQFITSGEEKWHRVSGITLLLPHAFEGQGPEHSSARLERFLQLACNDNVQVVYPTTPAQIFHVLRRQVLRPWRKPLFVMSPKSLLRHPMAVSSLQDLASGTFQRILPDTSVAVEGVTRVLLCSGKIYYDLIQEREKIKRQDVAIVRLEQLYPLHEDLLGQVLSIYPEGTPVVWVQEEPENMGAWHFLRVRYCHKLLDTWPFSGVHRAPAASPATGSTRTHKLEQQHILNKAFGF